jgi:hypothetical protein
MGGTAYAAVVLPKNSVGTQQIKPKGVKGSDIFGSSPSPGTGTPSGWSVLAAPPSGNPATSTVTAYVVCASP